MSHTEADYYESINIPPWERFTLTIPEAAEYYHIGEKRLYNMASKNYGEGLGIMLS